MQVKELIVNDAIPDWTPEPPPTDLIFDDGEPLESNHHRIAMNVLIRSMLTAFADKTDYFSGGNMFIYYSQKQVRNRDFRGPDFFVVLNVDGSKDRQGWVVWDEDGRYPDVIVELMSPSTQAIDLGVKKQIYAQTFRTPNYFVYDPFNPQSLQGWQLDPNQGYQELFPNQQDRLYCQKLGLWLGTWSGKIDNTEGVWLRFYDSEGNLILLPEEAAKQEAELAKQEAELAKQEAELAKQEARIVTQEKQQAEQARLDAIPKLLAMGLTVEQVADGLGLSVEQINQ